MEGMFKVGFYYVKYTMTHLVAMVGRNCWVGHYRLVKS